jgi:hypothetical protein
MLALTATAAAPHLALREVPALGALLERRVGGKVVLRVQD